MGSPVENSSQPLCFFWTDDLAAACEFLREREIAIVHEPEGIDSVSILTFEDPDRLMACERN